MRSVAIVYASRYGQTKKIVDRIANELHGSGLEVRTFGDPDRYPSSLEGYDFVLVGGPVYVGKMLDPLTKWAKAHARELKTKRLSVFSVSLNAADERTTAREADRAILDRFCAQAAIDPYVSRSLKGGLPYTKYGFLTRWLLRRISASAGGPTDTQLDYEMTDWDEVVQFAHEAVGETSSLVSATKEGAAKATSLPSDG